MDGKKDGLSRDRSTICIHILYYTIYTYINISSFTILKEFNNEKTSVKIHLQLKNNKKRINTD